MKRGRNRMTGEEFAIKIFKKNKLNEHDEESLISELLILRQLDHPNIVCLVEIVED